MDEYYSPVNDRPPQSKEMKEIDRAISVGIDEIGTTTNPFEHQTQALKARIFHGASRIEFGFFGSGKGRKEQATPESFGARERLDMRELAEINEVETTTHATVGVNGLSGLEMQQGKFDDRHRKESIDEIKRAIHFAAEASTGGAVVFHTGEAPRHMYGKEYMKDKEGNPMFRAFPQEEKRRQQFLVDPVSKKLVAQISEIDKVAMPEFEKDNSGNIKYLKDEQGKEVVDPTLKEYDPIHKGRVPMYKTDAKGNIITHLIDFSDYRKVREKDYQREFKRKPTEQEVVKDFFYQQKFVDVMYSLNFGIRTEGEYKELLEQRESIIKSLKFYKELKEKVPKDDWWKFEKEVGVDRLGLIPHKTEDPVNYLQKLLVDNERNISHTKEMALHGRRTATEQLDVVKRAELADDFAVKETSKSMAEVGIYAWQKTAEAHRNFKSGKTPFDLKNDLYLAPENLFPETYGSHPDELRTLILEGRKEMAKQLKDSYGMKEAEAKKIAEKTLKATFDIGHANIWRKYFISKEGESLESRDKRFNSWLLSKTKELLKEGIIGHIHVSDNFGFHDEHLTALDGNAPIREFIEQAKREGMKEFIIESGSFNPMTSLPDAWMMFDSPVYGVPITGMRNGFTDVNRSYFGRTEGPRYIVGEYSPSEDFKGAPFYTGLGID